MLADISELALNQARKCFSEGPAPFNGWCEMYGGCIGMDPSDVRDTVASIFATESIEGAVKGYSLPASLKALVARVNVHAESIGKTARITVDSDGLKVRWREKRTRSDTISENSNISGWTAYQRGINEGDEFRILKYGRNKYVDKATGGEYRSTIGLVRELYPDSHTARILREYGKLPPLDDTESKDN